MVTLLTRRSVGELSFPNVRADWESWASDDAVRGKCKLAHEFRNSRCGDDSGADRSEFPLSSDTLPPQMLCFSGKMPKHSPTALRSPPRSGVRVGCLIVLAGALASFGAAAREMQTTESPLGLWQTKGGGVIGISWCGQVLCGRILGIPRAAGEPIPKDATGQSQCGLTIIRQASEGQDGSWFGHIVDPRDNKQYNVELWVGDAGNLHVRGYIGLPLLGQTQVWHRYNGRVGADCTITSVL